MGSCLHFQNFCLFEFKHAIFNCSSRKHIRTFFLNATAENIFILHVAECWMVQQKLNRGVVFGKKIFASGWVVTFGVAVEFFTHRVYSEICIYYIAVLPNRCAARHSLPKRMFVPGLRSSCKNEMALAPELCLKHGSGCAFLIHFNNFGMPCVLLEQVNVLFQHILN